MPFALTLFTFSLAIVFGILNLVQFLAVLNFSKLFYSFGITVFRRTIKIETKHFDINKNAIFYREEGMFKFLSNEEVLFVSRFYLFRFNRTQSPFSFAAKGIIKDNKIHIKANIPYGVILFSSTIFFVSIAIQIDEKLNTGMFKFDYPFPLLFLSFIVGMIFLGNFIEQARMEAKIKELKIIIADHNPYYANWKEKSKMAKTKKRNLNKNKGILKKLRRVKTKSL